MIQCIGGPFDGAWVDCKNLYYYFAIYSNEKVRYIHLTPIKILNYKKATYKLVRRDYLNNKPHQYIYIN